MSGEDRQQQEEFEQLRAHLEREFCKLHERQLEQTRQLAGDPEFLALSPDDKTARLDDHKANQDIEMNARLDELTRKLPFDPATKEALNAGLNLATGAMLAAAGPVGAVATWGLALHTLCKELNDRQDARIDEKLKQHDRELAEQRSPEERLQNENDNAMLAVASLRELPETAPPGPEPQPPAPREAASVRQQLDVAEATLEGWKYLPPRADVQVATLSAGAELIGVVAHGLDAMNVAKDSYRTVADSPDPVMQAWDAANRASAPLALRNADTLERIGDAIRQEPAVYENLDASFAKSSAELSARQATGDLGVHERAQQHAQLEQVFAARRVADVTRLYEQALDERTPTFDVGGRFERA